MSKANLITLSQLNSWEEYDWESLVQRGSARLHDDPQATQKVLRAV